VDFIGAGKLEMIKQFSDIESVGFINGTEFLRNAAVVPIESDICSRSLTDSK
jgi:hypothetical protein